VPNSRGMNIISLRKVFEKAGKEKENQFLSQLSPELYKIYKMTMATSWNSENLAVELYQEAVRVLFPDQPKSLRLLGKNMAEITYSGIYRFILRIPSIPFVMKRVAHLWRDHHDTGQGTIEDYTGKSLCFYVRGFPELLTEIREVICGHIQVLAERTGAKNVQVVIEDENPEAWCWKVHWE
jgi:hypothetical protein